MKTEVGRNWYHSIYFHELFLFRAQTDAITRGANQIENVKYWPKVSWVSFGKMHENARLFAH